MSVWRITASALLIGMSFVFATSASAVPALQLYIEGATYDETTETWVATGGDTVRLWAIGNVGSVGNILNVRLAVSYIPGEDPVTVTLTGTQAGGTGSYMGVSDPSAASDGTYIQTVNDGSSPILSDGGSLSPHGIFNQDGVEWQEFALGDFTMTDSQVGDFITSFPGSFPTSGQINVYDVAITGVGEVHFDLYDSIEGANHASFAPFSHDAGGGGGNPPVPEPGTVALLGLGGLILAGRRIRGRKRSSE